ncbi:sensor histidine kinase [Hydrogenophaga flava]|uniref:sensor histidine kinase n=1 Tax=Hydrogenophaga flava TaxID=65657 RepID=UPI000826B971|nr:ATP-binding protein [Hydrogenophaga flava]
MPQWLVDWRQSLAFKLMVSYLLAWGLAAALVGVAVWVALQFQPADSSFRNAQRLTRLLGDSLVFDAQGRPQRIDGMDRLEWLTRALPDDFSYRVSDRQGRVFLSSTTAVGVQPEPPHPLEGHTLLIEHAGQTWEVHATVSQRLIDLIHLSADHHLRGVALATAGMSILLLGAVLWVVIQRLLRPLREASAQAMQINPQQLSLRLEEDDLPGELKPLVRAFNQVLDRLETGFRHQQRFLANAAHELKTPLALLRGQIELGGAHQTEQLLADVDQLARQVQQLLLLAEVSEPSNFKSETIHLMPLAHEVLGFLEPLARQRGVRLDLHFSDARTMVAGDRMALFALLRNLVENALNFAPAHSTVTLVLNAQSLEVIDQGPGIDPAHVAHVFDRFWRHPERRSHGAGLGLAICREIANAHRWQLTAHTRQPGALFRLEFG